MALVASSIDSTESYNGDDTHRYLYEWDEVLTRHWEVTQETKRLEATLAASQTALATVEGESSIDRAWLADSNTRDAGRTLRRNLALSSSLFCHVLLDDSFPFHFSPNRGIRRHPTGGKQHCQGL